MVPPPMTQRTIRLGLYLLCAAGAACAGSKARVDEPTRADGGAGDAVASADAPPPASVQRPFAATALEAQTMIQQQLDAHMKALWKCVEDYRAKKGDAHRPVTLDVGIDQEGTLLGVVMVNQKGSDLDPALKVCVMDVLRGAAFPRSHTGVITVRQSFQDTAVYR
jgi:hypothetical protein